MIISSGKDAFQSTDSWQLYGGSLSTVLGYGIGIADRDFEMRPDIRSGFNK